jgi:hypothetical protein
METFLRVVVKRKGPHKKQITICTSTQPFRVFIFENMADQVFIVPITNSV